MAARRGDAQDHRVCLGFPVAGLVAMLQQTLLSRGSDEPSGRRLGGFD